MAFHLCVGWCQSRGRKTKGRIVRTRAEYWKLEQPWRHQFLGVDHCYCYCCYCTPQILLVCYASSPLHKLMGDGLSHEFFMTDRTDRWPRLKGLVTRTGSPANMSVPVTDSDSHISNLTFDSLFSYPQKAEEYAFCEWPPGRLMNILHNNNRLWYTAKEEK